jgi:hypothetical protein
MVPSLPSTAEEVTVPYPLDVGGVDDYAMKVGSMLLTLVDPNRGFEQAYNRWYERDHFYAGCMIGSWNFGGARFVATRACKEKRYAADPSVTPDPMVGSYLAIYWILAGKFGEWMKWGTEQVNWLHQNDRMFSERDHIHTLMYRFLDEQHADPDGVPAELALDHHFPGLVAVIGEVGEGKTHDDVVRWFQDRPCPAEVMTAFTPVPLFQDAPSDVPRNEDTDRFLQLYFLDENPLEVFDDRFGDLGKEFDASGLGRILFVSPFLATVPGTDRYADELR